jgi:hypothetical protein
VDPLQKNKFIAESQFSLDSVNVEMLNFGCELGATVRHLTGSYFSSLSVETGLEPNLPQLGTYFRERCLMADTQNRRFLILCEQASKETDPVRLRRLVAELIEVIDAADPTHKAADEHTDESA